MLHVLNELIILVLIEILIEICNGKIKGGIN